MYRVIFTLLLLLTVSCGKSDIDRAENRPGNNQGNTENNGDNNNSGSSDKPVEWGDERSYVFDLSSLPEVHMTISLKEWNRILSEYDKNRKKYGCTGAGTVPERPGERLRNGAAGDPGGPEGEPLDLVHLAPVPGTGPQRGGPVL